MWLNYAAYIIGVESENSRLSLVDTQIVVAVVRQSLNRQHRRMHCVELTVLSNIKLMYIVNITPRKYYRQRMISALSWEEKKKLSRRWQTARRVAWLTSLNTALRHVTAPILVVLRETLSAYIQKNWERRDRDNQSINQSIYLLTTYLSVGHLRMLSSIARLWLCS